MKKFIIVIITILMSVVSYAQNTKTIDFNSLNWGFSDDNIIYRLESEGKVVFQHNYFDKVEFTVKVEKFTVSDSVFLALYDHYEKKGREVENAVKNLYEKVEKKYPFIHKINTEEYNSLKWEKISDLSINDLDYIKWYDSLIKRYGKSFVEKLERITDIYYQAKWIKSVGVSGFQMKFYSYDLLKKNQEQIEDFDEERWYLEMEKAVEKANEEFESPLRIQKMCYKYYDFVIYPQDKCDKFIKEYKTLVYSVL